MAPVLIVHGTADTMIGPDHARALARANPRARLMLMPGLDHDLAWDAGAQGIELEWLKQVLLVQPSQRHSPAGT